MLPLLASVTIFTGAAIGFITVGITGYTDARRRSFLFQSMMNNSSSWPCPLPSCFCPKRGAGLLFVHNLGIILVLWTFCVPILRENKSRVLNSR